MVLKEILTILAISLIIGSCNRYSKIKISRSEYTGNQFKTNGYYHARSTYFRMNEKRNDFSSVLIFYQNGFFRSLGFSTDSLNKVDSLLVRRGGPITFLEGSGYYQVLGDSISIEFWTNASHFPVPTATVQAKVLNDSTLKSTILGHYENDIWHFRPLSRKPDSTTIFDEQLEKGLPIKRGKKQKFLGIF